MSTVMPKFARRAARIAATAVCVGAIAAAGLSAAASSPAGLVDGPALTMPPVAGGPAEAGWLTLDSSKNKSEAFDIAPGQSHTVKVRDMGYTLPMDHICMSIENAVWSDDVEPYAGPITLASSAGESQTVQINTATSRPMGEEFGPGCITANLDGTITVSGVDRPTRLIAEGMEALSGAKSRTKRVIDMRSGGVTSFYVDDRGTYCSFNDYGPSLDCDALNQKVKAIGIDCSVPSGAAYSLKLVIGDGAAASTRCTPGRVEPSTFPIAVMDPKFSTVYLPNGYVCTKTFTKLSCANGKRNKAFQTSLDGSYVLSDGNSAKYWSAPR